MPFWLLCYAAATVTLLLYGMHAFQLLRWRRRHAAGYLARLREARERSDLGRSRIPHVLVQLPVYNEPAVVRRAIDAMAALDWPHDRFEIQVLDDSTDQTAGIVDRAVARHRARGIPVRVLRRARRDGYKAGALAAGLRESRAECVAVFDADFAPPPDFLRRALPLFDAADRVACVQGRWEHWNRDQNLLTKAQAVGIDAHFHVQQLARAAAGRFLNFNGTAGIWRRAAIDEGGGWCADTLTEDLDLSYRVQLLGWRIVFDPALAVRAEIPPTLSAYKSQQRRWACGSMQCARKHLPAVWRSGESVAVKCEATFHLCGYGVALAMMALVFLLPLGYGHVPLLFRHASWWPLWAAVWAAAAGPLAVSHAGQRQAGHVDRTALAACFLLGLGSTANNAVAVLRGLFRPLREFVRTPKQGAGARRLGATAPRLEPAMLLLSVGGAAALVRTLSWMTIPYLLFCSAGFWFMGGYWLLVEWPDRAHAPAERVA